MKHQRATLNRILTVAIALVWLINGLLCKVLNVVPRHAEIVGRILGTSHATLITQVIGTLEVGMFLWILSGFRPRLSAWLQIVLIAVMNTIECILAPDLLLFGRFNALFALVLITVIWLNEYRLRPPDPLSKP